MKKGTKVICKRIEGFPSAIFSRIEIPKVGKIYTIRKMVRNGNEILLEEIRNEKLYSAEGIREQSFKIENFSIVKKNHPKG